MDVCGEQDVLKFCLVTVIHLGQTGKRKRPFHSEKNELAILKIKEILCQNVELLCVAVRVFKYSALTARRISISFVNILYWL